SAIPNEVPEAHTDPEQRAFVIRECPCCGKKLKKVKDDSIYAVECVGPNCDLGKMKQPLPIWTVDQDVYRVLPSMVIGTVDKFAQIARNPDTGRLFGLGTPHHPPDLIIQDELHLISGPLGTIAGLYEVAVDEFCATKGSRPKIIGSTATIKMADRQVRDLFDRGVYQFPPPGIDATNSCFAVKDNKKIGRLYLGVTTAGRSAKFALQAVCASLLQGAGSPKIPETERDDYWTLVNYFNSMRELGGAHVLMLDDVPKSMDEYAGRRGEERRQIEEPAELTSRRSQAEIPQVLKQLKQTWKKQGNDAQDVLLSTNMISVGVDIPRLGLMVVNGQPKAISEYIQATSRVGRDRVPGLVVTMFNNNKPRDRSHYETFTTWHGTLYRDVEPTSVTPFAPRARDKALRAVLVAIVRHLVPQMAGGPNLTSANRTLVEARMQALVTRADHVDPEEKNDLDQALRILLDEWEHRGSIQYYWYDKQPKKTLLMSAEKVAALRAVGKDGHGAWAAPNSMRDVEPDTEFRLLGS
ncbi:MAG TPA: helicase-related protein, partial [Verrucomicrobiae bacterium]|nr:helicase-related protein [Verrucomicrobiae bacterium]